MKKILMALMAFLLFACVDPYYRTADYHTKAYQKYLDKHPYPTTFTEEYHDDWYRKKLEEMYPIYSSLLGSDEFLSCFEAGGVVTYIDDSFNGEVRRKSNYFCTPSAEVELYCKAFGKVVMTPFGAIALFEDENTQRRRKYMCVAFEEYNYFALREFLRLEALHKSLQKSD